MNDKPAALMPENFEKLGELHDKASHAVEAVLRRERIVNARKHAQSVSYSLAGADAPRVMQTLHEVFCETRGDK